MKGLFLFLHLCLIAALTNSVGIRQRLAAEAPAAASSEHEPPEVIGGIRKRIRAEKASEKASERPF